MSCRILTVIFGIGIVLEGIHAGRAAGQIPVGDTQAPAVSSCLCEEAPAWAFRGGALFMQRETPGRTLILSERNPAAPDIGQAVYASDFNFPMTSGFDLELLRRRDNWDFQFRIFALSDAAGPEGFVTADQGWMNFEQPVGFFGGPTRAKARYVYDLTSEEINFSYHWKDWCQPLLGLRIVTLNERLNMQLRQLDPYTLLDSAYLWDVDVNSYNSLVGFQIGSQFSFFNQGPLRLESVIKAGIYGNAAANSSRLRYHEAGLYYFSDADKGNAAFVGEIGLSGVYQITPHWACSLGYQLLWIDGLALAPEQVLASNPLDNSATVHCTSSVFFHGAFATIEYRW
jgi:hypothetical protein